VPPAGVNNSTFALMKSVLMDFVPRVSACFPARAAACHEPTLWTRQSIEAPSAHSGPGVQNERGFWNALSDIWVFNWCALAYQAAQPCSVLPGCAAPFKSEFRIALFPGRSHMFAPMRVSYGRDVFAGVEALLWAATSSTGTGSASRF